jgi:hypothetical protein
LIETDRFALCHRSGFNAYEDDTITRAGRKHGTSENLHNDYQDPRPSAPVCELPWDNQAARRGRVGKRIARRDAWRDTGKALGKIFKCK